MSLLLLLVAPAHAWGHTGYIHDAPLLLEVTTLDAADAPSGAVQQAIADAVADWTDDACLETLDLQLVPTDDNPGADVSDGRSTVSVDLETYADGVTYTRSDGGWVERFGESYRVISEVDLVLGPATWALPDDVDAGACDGPALPLTAYRLVGFMLGMDSWEPAPDSLYALPDCSHPVLGDDDREGLRALYGSGVELSCVAPQITHIGFDSVGLNSGCTVGTYGASPLLEQWWVLPDGTEVFDRDAVELTEPGSNRVQVCGSFDVDEACDRTEVCVDDPVEYVVCETPEPVLSWEIDSGELVLFDDTPLTDERCIDQRRWVLRGADGDEEIVGSERQARFPLPDAATVDVELELSLLETHTFSTTTSVPLAAEPVEDIDDKDASTGCGCATGATGGGGMLALLVGMLGRRRRGEGTSIASV